MSGNQTEYAGNENHSGKINGSGGLLQRDGAQERAAAIVLAAGSGTRMGTAVKKQYLLLEGKPLLWYSLRAFEESEAGQIVLVTGEGEEEYCRAEIVEKYGFRKISHIISGGRERYQSVYEGLKVLGAQPHVPDYVLIHDGARPLVEEALIRRTIEDAVRHRACAAGMPSKDTIKLSDDSGFAETTPDRSRVWTIQTPQTFFYPLIREAYERMMSGEEYQKGITDDAMVVERMMNCRVKLTEGSYENMKVTTPEDMEIAAAILRRRRDRDMRASRTENLCGNMTKDAE